MALGRPIKKGLDYFQLDTSPGDKIRYLKKKVKMDGYGIFVSILERIYKYEGYYCKWDEMSQVLFCDDGIELEKLKQVVNCCFEVGLFDKPIFDKYCILTSKEIQKRYMVVIHLCKRKGIKITSELNLIFGEETPLPSEETRNELSDNVKTTGEMGENDGVVFSEETAVISGNIQKKPDLIRNKSEEMADSYEETPINSESNTQRKGKEKKGKERKTFSASQGSADFKSNGHEKSDKIEKVKKSPVPQSEETQRLFDMEKIYNNWLWDKHQIPPSDNFSLRRKKIKEIILFFEPYGKDKITENFKYLLYSYDHWDNFHKRGIKIQNIASQLANIVLSVKNWDEKFLKLETKKEELPCPPQIERFYWAQMTEPQKRDFLEKNPIPELK